MNADYETIEIEIDGAKYRAFYEVDNELLTVYGEGDESKATQLGGMNPRHLASMLMKELIQE